MSKLDWMYKSSSTADPEDYLLGKAIDKNFETQGSSRNEVDKDILPTSIFANANSSAPVDIFRKTKEDPLEQIKQKEIEMRKQLLKNPVKLKKLQTMLKAKAEKKDLMDHKKNKKKNKGKAVDDRLAQLLQKYGTKKLIELTKSNESSEDDNGRSKERNRKNKRNKTRSDSSSSSDRFRDRDERGGKSSRDLSLRYEEKKRKVKRRKDNSGGSRDRRKYSSTTSVRSRDNTGRSGHSRVSSESSGDGRSPSRERKRKSGIDKADEVQGLMNEYMKLIKEHGAKTLMELIGDELDEDRKKKSKKHKRSQSSSGSDSDSDQETRKSSYKEKQSIGRTKKKKASTSCSSSGSEDEKRRKLDHPKKFNRDASSKDSRKPEKRSSSSSSYSPADDDNPRTLAMSRRPDGGYSSDECKSSFKKAYGLVLPKGVEHKPKSSSQPAVVSSSKKVDDQKSKLVRPKQSKLTEEEKEAKLKEMMANAQWRDQERRTNVAKYREEAKKEADSQKYDEGFMRKELAKAVDSSKSVEERIKSRMNNVQRSKFSMSQNFARRT